MNKNVFKGIWLITKCFPLKKIIFILQFYYSFLHGKKETMFAAFSNVLS